MSPRKLSILGSTGSIGVQALQVVDAFPGAFSIVGLSAGSNLTLFKHQLLTYKPQVACIRHESDLAELHAFIQSHHLQIDLFWGDDGLCTLATSTVDLLLVAIVGTASLKPTYRAIDKGIPIALACKEVLVSAGDLIMDLARKKKVPIIPVDSEHAALKQCLAGIQEDPAQIQRLILTASGGPFFKKPLAEFASITRANALAHPNWSMGAKISIDSATMMNKGLEVIEAHHLFNIPYEKLDVAIHPPSLVHSVVDFVDGTYLAQMGPPDMRFPIQYALFYPDKLPFPWPRPDLFEMGAIEFFKPDFQKFPLLKLAFDIGKLGSSLSAVMNAANEAAVGLFLAEKISFLDIFKIVEATTSKYSPLTNYTLEDILELDLITKRYVTQTYG